MERDITMKENGMKNKKVFVLLTRFPDNGSKVIEAMTGFFYTHASIGLSEDMNTFYSFVAKGFIVEKITKYIRPDRIPFPCQLYEIEVSDKIYKSIRKLLNSYDEYRNNLHYTRLGLVMCLLRIPYKRKDHYICSQFVAEVLENAQVAKLKKDSTLYRPSDLSKLLSKCLIFEGNLQSMITHFKIQPCLV